MKEDFITYKTAKLANEKGVKIDINSFFAIDDYLYDEGTRFEVSECTCHTEDDYCTCLSGEEYSYSKKCIYAPTQSLLQKYLRNNHKIVVISRPSAVGQYDTIVWNYDIYTILFNGTFKVDVGKILTEEYEQALEIGLQGGLKLL